MTGNIKKVKSKRKYRRKKVPRKVKFIRAINNQQLSVISQNTYLHHDSDSLDVSKNLGNSPKQTCKVSVYRGT